MSASTGRRRGRPRSDADTRRHHRMVTFVTDSELERLEEIAARHERSLSAVVHRMIVAQLQREEEGADSEPPREEPS